jgi:lysozyme
MSDGPIAQAVSLAKQFEGCRLAAYQDPAGIWTIAWGETWYWSDADRIGRLVREGDVCTQDQADLWLFDDMADRCKGLIMWLPSGTTDSQAAACLDLAYNIGLGNFRSSTLLRLLIAGDVKGAADQFLVWDKAHVDGQLVTLPGLLKRREAERALFLGGA